MRPLPPATLSVLLAALSLVLSPGPSNAIFFRTVEAAQEQWTSSATCAIAYYNTCTGWAWAWSGWSSNDELGVCFETCCTEANSTLIDSRIFCWTGAPSGYSFTGTVSVYDVDANHCPVGAPLATQPWLPTDGDNEFLWNVAVNPTFAIVARIAGSQPQNPVAFASDHPAMGPTGGAACGTCYPSTRVNRSFYYGAAGSPLCPGSPLTGGGTCVAQLVFDAGLHCEEDPTSLATRSWGGVKGLYR